MRNLRSYRRFRTANAFAATALLALGASIAGAEDSAAPSTGFRLWADPIVLSALETDVDTDSARFQEYRDLGSGFRGALRILGESADGNRTMELVADNLSRDDARYTLEYGYAGKYSFLLDYNKIPHRFGNAGKMLHTRTGPGTYEIADPVQAQLQGALERQAAINRAGINFAFLEGLVSPYLTTARDTDIGLQRNRTHARFELGQLGKLAWALDYTHENRDGTRPWGASLGFNNVIELPEPIAYDTTGTEVSGEWWAKQGGLRFGYRHSTFENSVSTLVWDNPFRATNSTDANAYQSPGSASINGATRGFADLAPDSQASLFFTDGRLKLGSWWATGAVSYGVMTQDEDLLPYTLNAAIRGVAEDGSTFDPTDRANLPTLRADNEIKTLHASAEAGTRFADDFSLTFRYRYYDHDNTSERIEFPGYVRFHAVWEPIPRVTVPFDYTRTNLGAELGWDLSKTAHLGLAYKRETWDRSFREVEGSDEDLLSLSFDYKPSTKLSLRASYDYGDRSIDGYRPEAQEESFLEPEGVNNLQGLRKYDQAARNFDGWNVQMQLFPTDAWSFTMGATSRDDDYDESEFGLIADELLQYNAELSFTPSDKLSAFLFGHRAERDSFQRARQSGATPSTREIDTWELALAEENDTFGLGMEAKLAERWKLGLDGQWSRSDGVADFLAFVGGLPLGGRPAGTTGALDFDNYEDIELTTITSRLDFQLSARTGLGFWYRYEDFTIDSFILQGLRNYLPGALLLNASNGDYQADVFAVELKLAF
jgi:MtrB/PioB family decaheme-associated outer membrane protein